MAGSIDKAEWWSGYPTTLIALMVVWLSLGGLAETLAPDAQVALAVVRGAAGPGVQPDSALRNCKLGHADAFRGSVPAVSLGRRPRSYLTRSCC